MFFSLFEILLPFDYLSDFPLLIYQFLCETSKGISDRRNDKVQELPLWNNVPGRPIMLNKDV